MTATLDCSTAVLPAALLRRQTLDMQELLVEDRMSRHFPAATDRHRDPKALFEGIAAAWRSEYNRLMPLTDEVLRGILSSGKEAVTRYHGNLLELHRVGYMLLPTLDSARELVGDAEVDDFDLKLTAALVAVKYRLQALDGHLHVLGG